MEFFCYAAILIILILSPDDWWDYGQRRLIQSIEKIKTKVLRRSLKYRFESVCGYLGSVPGTLRIDGQVSLPQYKYYTDLVVTILNHARQFGIPVQDIFKNVRLLMIKDYQFERKLNRELLGAIIQFVMTALITWFFILSTVIIVNIKLTSFVLIVIVVLQIGGGTLFVFNHGISKKRSFRWYDKYFQAIICLKALSHIGLATQKCIQLSEISVVIEGPLDVINRRLEVALEQWQKNGVSMITTLEDCTDELVFLLNERFTKFVQKTILYKFLVLSIFFLPCYLFYLFWIFQNFFEI